MRTNLVSARAVQIQLRPASAADEPFLYALYADRRAPELRPLGWGADEQRAFVDMQFRAQQSGYAEAHPGADHWIPWVGDEPVGRVLVDRHGAEQVVVDLVVLSRFRGLGIGTALMEEVLADARSSARCVRLMVEAGDQRLIRWYERLGFVRVDEQALHVEMQAHPFEPAGA